MSRRRRFSDEEILDAIRQWVDQHGRSPSMHDWRQAGGRPQAGTIARRFGTWNAALAAAGIPSRPRDCMWSDETILEEIRVWARKHGRSPRTTDWEGPPHLGTIQDRFGSLATAVRRAGIQPIQRRWTLDDDRELRRLRDAGHRVREIADRLGQPPESVATRLRMIRVRDQNRRLAGS